MRDMSFLNGKSSTELDEIALEAAMLSSDLRKKQPSYDLALLAGVKDTSYRTTRFGVVDSYTGEAEVTMEDGSKWKCVGHGPTGSPGSIKTYGYIEFIPM